jgi:hypothetical protein
MNHMEPRYPPAINKLPTLLSLHPDRSGVVSLFKDLSTAISTVPTGKQI